jgi:tRNA G10  N-methylase Trm11
LTYGCDIDIRVLKGFSIGYSKGGQHTFEKKVKISKNKDTELNIFTNFKDYGFILPQILRCDINHPSFRQGEIFDAIICDPPYGHRAFSRSTGIGEEKKERREKRLRAKYGENYCEKEIIANKGGNIEEKENDIYLHSPLIQCSVDQIFQNLLNLADKCLKDNGLLVCLYPTKRNKEEAEYIIL